MESVPGMLKSSPSEETLRSVFRRRVTSASLAVLLGVLFGSLGLQRSVMQRLVSLLVSDTYSAANSCDLQRPPIMCSQLPCLAIPDCGYCHLRDFLLRPLEISAHLASILHAVSEASACLGKTSLSLRLQFQEFSLLSIEMSRSVSLR